MIRILPRAFGAIALAAAFLGTGALAQSAPEAFPLTPEQWRADLQVLMDGLKRTHKNLYHSSSAATLDSAATSLHERIPGLARHEIILEMGRIVALVGDGHTNIYPTRDRAIGFQTLPIAMYLFKDGLHIRAADQAHAELAGARVLRIGDATAEDAYGRARPYIGRDNEMGAKFFVPHLLAMPEVLHALRLAPSVDSARFELEVRGKRRTLWLRPIGPAPLMAGDTDKSWRPKPGWVDARDRTPGPDPLWLRVAPDTTLWWFTALPESHAVYAQINQVRNGEAETFGDFSRRLLAFVDTSHTSRLVLDLRLNRGGNGELLAPLVRGILKRPKINERGKLIVLMGRSTWSAAQFLLNDLEEFSEAVFVGEPSGSKGNSYGDSRQIKLPNSGVTARASIYYWQDWFPTDPRPWTAPEIAAEMTSADYIAKRDPALDAALRYVARKPLDEQVRTAVAAWDTAGARRSVRAFRVLPAHAYANALASLDAAAVDFYNRKDFPQAAWIFGLAANEYPDNAQAQLNAASLYEKAGQRELAIQHYERVLKLEPLHEAAATRLRELKKP